MATEAVSDARLVTYINLGIIEGVTTTEVENVIGDTIEITRPLYGLQFLQADNENIAKFVQVHATEVRKKYRVAEPWKGSRVYVEEHETGVSLFMVTVMDTAHLANFTNLTSNL